jgi:hypothetical protein
VFLPVPTDLPLDEKATSKQLRLANEAGFVVINLSNVFDGHNPQDLSLRDQGRHINAKGNALVAAALYHHLESDPRIDLFNRAQRNRSKVPAESSVPQR